MKFLDRFLFYFSWSIIISLGAIVVAKNCSSFSLPLWFEHWGMPILTAAAVGYLTNWIAIWLLFKPYTKKWGFIQGVIPRNKSALGHELGEIIPQYLLKPDELAKELSCQVKNYLQDPALLSSIRSTINLFLSRYSRQIADFLLPHIEEVVKSAVTQNLNQEKLVTLYDNVVVSFLQNPDNRNLIASAITVKLNENIPDAIPIIKDELKKNIQEYIQEEYPALAFVKIDSFAPKLVDWLNWNKIQSLLEDKLSQHETQIFISEKLQDLTIQIKEYLQSPQAMEKLSLFISQNRAKVEEFLKNYLSENIPIFVDEYLKKDEFWLMVENQLLPLLQAFILNKLKHDKEKIIENFNIPQKVKNSVDNMKIDELHKMIIQASNNNLTVIQILGFVLGGFAGILLILAN